MPTKLKTWLPTALWAVLIFTLSSIPSLKASDNPILQEAINTTAHFAEYFILSILLTRSLVRNNEPSPLQLSSSLSLLFALSDEIHQFFVPGRMFDTKDILIDALGIVVASLWLRRKHRTIIPKSN